MMKMIKKNHFYFVFEKLAESYSTIKLFSYKLNALKTYLIWKIITKSAVFPVVFMCSLMNTIA